MTTLRGLTELEQRGAMRWHTSEHAWVARPDEIVHALAGDGFQEYRRETANERRGDAPAGGMWQGLDPRTGAIATVIWITRATPQDVRAFIEVAGISIEADDRGAPVAGAWWTGIDDAVLTCLRGGRLTPAEIGEQVGMSVPAVQSVLAILATQGKVEITAATLPERCVEAVGSASAIGGLTSSRIALESHLGAHERSDSVRWAGQSRT